MSLNPSVIPRRLAQPHGAYYNAVLSPNITVTRKYGARRGTTKGSTMKPLKKEGAGENQALRNTYERLNANLVYTANDEVFDVRAGEPLVSSRAESGFSPHGRGFVFSSVNGYTTPTGETDPNEALYKSDCKFAGLCQSDFTSANAALQEQGLAVQCSGIKTILNDSADTIHMGDKLMLHIPEKPGGSRRGVPLEKVRFSLKRVPANFVESTVIPRMIEAVRTRESLKDLKTKFPGKLTWDILLQENGPLQYLAPYMIASFRKSARLVVAKAVSSGRPDHQIDVKLTAPTFL